MNTAFALVAIIGGVIISLVGYEVIRLDKFISPTEAQLWHEKYGKLTKILGPAAGAVGLLLLVF